jgi:IPT/TIG domain
MTTTVRCCEFIVIATLACGVAGCAGTTQQGNTSRSSSSVTVSIVPSSASVRLRGSQQFMGTVSGSSNTSLNWAVDGILSGNQSVGTISATGLYQAPAALPNSSTVTVSAVSAVDSSAKATSSINLENPIPVLSSVAPSNFQTGSFALSLTGSNFVNGAQVLFGGTAIATTFISPNQLSASGTTSITGTIPVAVVNPDPSSATSGAIDVSVAPGSNTASACSRMSTGQGGSLNGFVPFPADNLWNTYIANAPVDPNSSAIINFIGASDPLHPDFGSGLYNGSSIGIPYIVVDDTEPFVNINFTAYGSESDPGPMPVPATAPIEGYPAPGNGDRHVLVLDNNNCWLYELYSAYPQTDGGWNAASAAVWDLTADEQRPLTWTSADAAGLPIFPGLVRYDEVAAGRIDHAIRFTLQNSRAAFTPPASHWAANSTNSLAAPMGMRLRLKANFDISGFSPTNQVILKALQQYGMIMADNGSNMFISGAPDDHWDNNDLHNLASVTASDFEVVQMNPVYTQSNLAQGSAPVVNSFSASQSTVAAGTPVTLSWNVSGASYLIVSPQVGAVRGSSVQVTPTQTTTYTLYATNEFGRTTATFTVTVQ